MSALQGDAESLAAEIDQKGYISVNDPYCGAGAMLIAFADYCVDQGIHYPSAAI